MKNRKFRNRMICIFIVLACLIFLFFKRRISFWMTFMFIVCLPLTLFSRPWIWIAAYQSAGTTQKGLDIFYDDVETEKIPYEKTSEWLYVSLQLPEEQKHFYFYTELLYFRILLQSDCALPLLLHLFSIK